MTNYTNDSKCIEALQALKANLDETLKKLRRRKKTSGQSWGGAGAMIISNDEETLKQLQHLSSSDVILSSPDFNELGALYNLLRKIISNHQKYNYFTKLAIWPEITNSLIEIESTGTANLEQKVVVAINKTIELLSSDF